MDGFSQKTSSNEIKETKDLRMDTNSIFISQNEMYKDNDISGKITYTSIMETIPETKTKIKIDNWQKKYTTEWRWRFFDLKGRKLIEISKMEPNKERMYMENTGKWIKYTLVSPAWDRFLIESKYCYISS